MDLEPFENIGLNSNEALVYIALLEEGAATAGKIAEKTHLHRRTVYDTINALKEKGLVSSVHVGGTLHFAAVDPERLIDICHEKEASIRRLLPELKLKRHLSRAKPSAQVFQGLKAIKTIFEDILTHKEYVAFAEGMKIVEFLGPFFDYFQKEKMRRKIRCRIVMGEKYRFQKTVTESYSTFRFLDDYEPPMNTFVYGSKIAMIVFSETPIAFLINSKETAHAHMTYFEHLWKRARK